MVMVRLVQKIFYVFFLFLCFMLDQNLFFLNKFIKLNYLDVMALKEMK